MDHELFAKALECLRVIRGKDVEENVLARKAMDDNLVAMFATKAHHPEYRDKDDSRPARASRLRITFNGKAVSIASGYLADEEPDPRAYLIDTTLEDEPE